MMYVNGEEERSFLCFGPFSSLPAKERSLFTPVHDNRILSTSDSAQFRPYQSINQILIELKVKVQISVDHLLSRAGLGRAALMI